MNMSRAAEKLMRQNNAEQMFPQTGWSQAGYLACQGANARALLHLPPLPGNLPAAGNSVKLQVCFPKCDVYTVQFELAQQTQVVTGVGADLQVGQLVYADLVWKVHGTTVRRSMTVISGSTISGVGEALEVTVYDGSPLGSYVGVPGLPYSVTINVSPGLRSAQSQQPYYAIVNPSTEGSQLGIAAFPVALSSSLQVFFPQLGTVLSTLGNIPPTATGILKPIGATSLEVVVGSTGPGGGAPPNPILNQQAQVSIDNTSVIYDPRDCQRWVPMPPGAFAVTLYNNSTTDGMVFYVARGIDG
jgi:hypothetical protein